MNVRNEIKAQIIRAGFTMQEVVDLLHDEYGWSDSVSNLSAKLQRESIRYKEVMELPKCWALKSYGESGVTADGSTAVRYFTICQVQGTGDQRHRGAQ